MRARIRQHSVELVLSGVFLMTAAWFYNGANWNQVSRYDQAFCFVEPGPDRFTFQINRLVWDPVRGRNTGDWATNPAHDRNLYSNKAPGPALLAIPVYALLYGGERLLGCEPQAALTTYVNCYLLNLAVTVLPATLSLWVFYHLLLGLFSGRRLWPTLLTVTLYFGTLMLPYSTQLWGHVTAAAFLVFGLYALHRGGARGHFWSGLFLGVGVLCEYSLAIPVLAVAVLLSARRQFCDLGRLCLGGAAPLFVFLAYHYICFGSPLTLATFHNNQVFKDDGAVGGLFQLQGALTALWHLTLSPYRGLLFHMPVLAAVGAAPFACGRLRRQPLVVIALASIVGVLLMNLTFNGWHGGACVGPRYQICALPLYVLVMALAVRELLPRVAHTRAGPALAAGFGLLLAVSVLNMFVIAAVSPLGQPLTPELTPRARRVWSRPLVYYYLAVFKTGRLQPYALNAIRPGGDSERAERWQIFNLGEVLGLGGRTSLLPVAVLWLAGAGALVYLLRAGAGPPGDRDDHAAGAADHRPPDDG